MISTLSQNPLFIIGSPRSGTSLLRLIMTSHTQVLIPPECGFITWLHNKYGSWCSSDSNDSIRLECFLDDLFECKKMDTWMMNREDVKKQILINHPSTYSELCSIIYLSYAISTERDFQLWGDKNNFYLNHLDELHSLYDNARFLHIVRDGRDVACSYREVMSGKTDSPYAPKLETNISDISIEWSNNVLKIDSFMTKLPIDRAMTIKYEDLVSDPENIINSVCRWLSIPFEASMINYYKENKSKKLEPEMTLDWKKRTLEPISNATVGRHARLLTSEDQYKFKELANIALKRFNYT